MACMKLSIGVKRYEKEMTGHRKIAELKRVVYAGIRYADMAYSLSPCARGKEGWDRFV